MSNIEKSPGIRPSGKRIRIIGTLLCAGIALGGGKMAFDEYSQYTKLGTKVASIQAGEVNQVLRHAWEAQGIPNLDFNPESVRKMNELEEAAVEHETSYQKWGAGTFGLTSLIGASTVLLSRRRDAEIAVVKQNAMLTQPTGPEMHP